MSTLRQVTEFLFVVDDETLLETGVEGLQRELDLEDDHLLRDTVEGK